MSIPEARSPKPEAPMGPEAPVAPTGAVGPEDDARDAVESLTQVDSAGAGGGRAITHDAASDSASAAPSPLLQSAPSPAFLWGDWVWDGSKPRRPLGRLSLEADGRLCITVEDDRYSGHLDTGTAFDLALAILELRQERIERLTAEDYAVMIESGRCPIDGKKLDRRPARAAGHFEWVCPCGLTVSE